MSCKKPLIRVAKNFDIGDKHYSLTERIIGSSEYGEDFYEYMMFQEKVLNELAKKDPNNRYLFECQRIPCGKCIGCKLDYSKEWATRCTLEASLYKYNWFITYTYDDEHIRMNEEYYDQERRIYTKMPNKPGWNGHLEPEDMVLFHKRLRQHLARHYDHIGYRFFFCGEYGGESRTLSNGYQVKGYRPHYHEIAFNMPIPVSDLVYIGRNKKGSALFECKWLTELWGKGRVVICEFSWSTAAYTARYCTKKIYGPTSPEYYASRGQTPEFVRMSRMPGIAREFYELNKDKIYKYGEQLVDEIIIKTGKEEIRNIKPVKYYDQLFDIEYPDTMKEIKDIRKARALNAERIKMANSSLTLLKQLELEERILIDKSKSLRRNEVD